MAEREVEFWAPPGPERTDYTLLELVAGRETSFPALARAAKDTRPAHDVRIEWLVDVFDASVEGKIRREVWHNYMQIFRWPYKEPARQGSNHAGGDRVAEEALDRFLAPIEFALTDGVPHRDVQNHCATCGGYRHYLGRDLNDHDWLTLRPLKGREAWLWKHDWKMIDGSWVALDYPEYEWLAELSLEVRPGG